MRWQIIPGGAKGADRLSKDEDVQKLIWSFYEVSYTPICPVMYRPTITDELHVGFSERQGCRNDLRRLAGCEDVGHRTRQANHLPPFREGRA